MNKSFNLLMTLLLSLFFFFSCNYGQKQGILTEAVLDWANFSHHVAESNQNDEELYIQFIPNAQTDDFLKRNIPYFSCPDKELEKTYYFRWWPFRKHIKTGNNSKASDKPKIFKGRHILKNYIA